MHKRSNEMKHILTLALFLLTGSGLAAQPDRPVTFASAEEARWVDSVLHTLSLEQQLGQLFMIRAHSDLGAEHIAEVEAQIRNYQVGGLCFFQGSPQKQVELINRYQQLSRPLPLLVAIDAEWGLAMRMPNESAAFPYNLTLGAIQDNDLLYDMGHMIADQLKAVGVHVNFAPVADVNNNPANPVINFRSFGEDRYNVAVKSYMLAKGMQDNGVLACAKHFPGHGDTDLDSHLDLPLVPHDRRRIDSIELYPFQALADQEIGSMMVAHIQIPALDDRPNRPTSLSRPTITGLLRQEMGYDGLIFTDALEMKGVTKHFSTGAIAAEALLAGNDVLVLPEDLAASIAGIKAYLATGQLTDEQVRNAVRRVLRAKYRLGVHRFQPLSQEGLDAAVRGPKFDVLNRRLLRDALTLVRNRDQLLPFMRLDSLRMASLSLGSTTRTPFQDRLASYQNMDHFQAPKELPAARSAELLEALSRYETVVVGLHDLYQNRPYGSGNYGITDASLEFLRQLNSRTRVVLVVFGNPYALRSLDAFDWVLMAYQKEPVVQDLAAQALFGAFALRGRLPVTASPHSTFNTGLTTRPAYRMGYALPEEVGLHSDSLARIAVLANEAIQSGATPGCVVLVAKNGQVVYHEAFGYHTYDRRRKVDPADVYDLASVTKVAAATLSLMRLKDVGRVQLDEALSRYLPALDTTDKRPLTIREIMAHHAGLHSWIPFYEQTVTASRRNPRPLAQYYRNREEGAFSVPVTDRLFMRRDFIDTMFLQIAASPLRPTKDYHYSDLGFYLLSELVRKSTRMPLDQYAGYRFYRPLGLQATTFNPWKTGLADRVVATEEDAYFRRQRIQGYVHDMGAAMLGGVSGHAGLFSNANDLAILMQMLLQRGFYGGRRYLEPITVQEFTTRYAGSSRRGLGFDMRELNPDRAANMSPLASAATFGHLGFTGTCVWVDPQAELIYVFLSNRTYPTMHNYRLSKYDYRPRIQSIIYRAMDADAGDIKSLSGI